MKKILTLIFVGLIVATPVSAASRFTNNGSYTDAGGIYSGSSFTSEFWIYAVNLTNRTDAIGIDDNHAATNVRQIQLFFGTDGSLNANLFTNCAGGNVSIGTGALISPSNWYYLRITWNGTSFATKIWNSSRVLADSSSIPASTICTTGAKTTTLHGITQGNHSGDIRLTHFYFNDGVAETNDKASLARAFSRSPWSTAPRLSGKNYFLPMFFGTETRQFGGATVTDTNTPSTEADPPVIPGRY